MWEPISSFFGREKLQVPFSCMKKIFPVWSQNGSHCRPLFHKHIVPSRCERSPRDIPLTKALENEWKEPPPHTPSSVHNSKRLGTVKVPPPPPHFPGSLEALKSQRAATADYFTQLSQQRGNEVMPPVSDVLCRRAGSALFSLLLPWKVCTAALWLSHGRELREATGWTKPIQPRRTQRKRPPIGWLDIPPWHRYSQRVGIPDIQPSTPPTQPV